MLSNDISSSLPSAFPKALTDASHLVSLAKNEILFQPNDDVDSIFYIIEGELYALRYQLDGRSAVMMRSFSGEIFAPASLNMPCYPCSGVATKNSKLLKIPKKVMLEHLNTQLNFAQYYIQSLAMELKKQCARSERLRLKSACERVMHFITCESPSGQELTLSYPMSKWAEELGLEPESLYRCLSDMEKKGVILREKRHIKIIKP